MNDKYKNIKKLKTIRGGKLKFYPALRLISKSETLTKSFFWVTAKLSLYKKLSNITQYLQYHNYKKYFFERVRSESAKKILYFHMSGVNSVHTFISMLFAHYFSKKGFQNNILYCNKALSLCSQDRIFKTRENFFGQCDLCVSGFDDLNSTGVLNTIPLEIKEDTFYNKNEEFQSLINTVEEAKNSNELIKIKLGDFELGKYVSFRVMRFFFRGYLNCDENELSIFKKYLIETAKFYFLFEDYLKKNKPTHAIIHNGSFNFGNVVRYLLKRDLIPYITFETFIGNNSIIYKKNDEVMRLRWDDEYKNFLNKNSTASENPQIEKSVSEFMAKIKDGSVLYAKLNNLETEYISNDENFCVLFTNLNFDSAVIGKHTIFNSMTEWIKETVRFWEENIDDVKLYIRIHPGEKKLVTPSEDFVSSILDNNTSSKVVIIDATNEISSYELIEKMKFGIIYSSTIGLEVLYYGKECVIGGDPFFLTSGLFDKFSNLDEYYLKLQQLISQKVLKIEDKRKEELIKYLYFFYFLKVNKIEGCTFNLKNSTGYLIYPTVEEVIEKNKEFFETLSKDLIMGY